MPATSGLVYLVKGRIAHLTEHSLQMIFLQIFGTANQHLSKNDTSAPFGNSRWGYEAINHGYDFVPGNNRTTATSLDPNDLTPAFAANSPAPGNGFINGSRLNAQNGQMAFPLPPAPEGFSGTNENWQAHFGQFPHDYVPKVPGQNTYVPWYSLPAVRGNSAPAGGPGDTKSPVKPELEKKRSEVPDFPRCRRQDKPQVPPPPRSNRRRFIHLPELRGQARPRQVLRAQRRASPTRRISRARKAAVRMTLSRAVCPAGLPPIWPVP